MNKRAACLLALLALAVAAADGTQAQSPGGDARRELPPNDVDVSLGRREVKERVAGHLGIKPADVPLSVQVPQAVARQVCGMEELSATEATRSCTATVFTPALAEAAANTSR
jgi:hypothetical protein